MSAKVQEGDSPPENPQSLLDEFERTLDTLSDLIQRINRTNSQTEIEPGVTISDVLARRDALKMRFDTYRLLAQSAMAPLERYTRFEVKFQSTVNVADLRKRADETAQAHRDLDTKIQALNWSIDLVE